MDVGVGATVERRTTQLLEDAKRSYERAWREFELSYEQAMGRLEELFGAYEEFLRLLSRPDRPQLGADRDLVFVFEEGGDDRGAEELVFAVRPLPPTDVVGFFGSAGRWGDPFP